MNAPGVMARRRRRLWIGAAAAIGYAVVVLVVAARSGAAGFASILGGPVVALEEGSPAERAGLRRGDVIVAVDGRPVTTVWERERALERLEPGQRLTLEVERGDERRTVTLDVARRLPFASAAGAALAAALLLLAVLAGAAGPRGPARAFFRSAIVYVFFLVGTFAWEAVLRSAWLAIPWLLGMNFAAPVTCHFVLLFPAGPERLSRRQTLWLYVPPLVVASAHVLNVALFRLHLAGEGAWRASLVTLSLTVALAAAYLSIGAVARARRLRRKRGEIDPVAARWLHAGGAMMAGSLVGGAIAAAVDFGWFIGGGFRPFIGAAMVGGSIGLVMAMTRERFGQLDRVMRRGTVHAVANAVAAAFYLGVIVVASGSGVFTSARTALIALGATLLAALVFGPLRSRIQRLADERFARDRARARRLLRDAAETAVRTLDVEALQRGVVHAVKDALAADGAALVVPREPSEGGWRQVATAGSVPIGDPLGPSDPIARALDHAMAAGGVVDLAGGMVASPIPVKDRPIVLVVAPSAARPLDDEERELIATLVAGLAVAVANARAHSELRAVSERLREEVEIAERRRREIARLKERIEEEKQVLEAELTRLGGRAPVIGAGLRPTFELVQKVAKSEVTVLVWGETGVGKELVARAIHAASARRAGPFVVVDCGAVAKGLFESALFGHEKGAFTGATRASVGAFRAAHGGTIFLDEIGELPLDLQPKLLRVLQEKEVRPVGGERTIPVDVRVVAGTNRDLAAEVAAGRFREDLLYRLRVLELQVPPLRARKRDIPELAEQFLRAFAERRGQPPKRLAPDALAALFEHDWPGNVRELEHCLEAAALTSNGDEIRAGDLPISGEVFRRKAERAMLDAGRPGLRETLEQLERERLIQALREHGGNRTAAARALGLSRGALLRRIERYGVEL